MPKYMLECLQMTKQSWLSSFKTIARLKLECVEMEPMIAAHLKLLIWACLCLRLKLLSQRPSLVKSKIFQQLLLC